MVKFKMNIVLVALVYHIVSIVAEDHIADNIAHVCTKVALKERISCLSNSTKESCTLKGCCWDPHRGPGCFYPKTNDINEVCAIIPNKEKVDCLPKSVGKLDPDRKACVERGCCWHDRSDPGPWCFYPRLFVNPPIYCSAIPEEEKVDCLRGIHATADEEFCAMKGCCWFAKDGPGPWCYHPKLKYVPPRLCSAVPDKEKVDCLSGANKESCILKGCCWHQKAGPGPWCFHPKTFDFDTVCAHIKNEEKIDCLPNADEKSCLSKGCCWQSQTGRGPWCFHPKLR